MKNNTLMALMLVGSAGSVAMAGVTTDNRTQFIGSIEEVMIDDSFEAHNVDLATGARTLSFAGFDASFGGSSLFGIANELNETIGVGATEGSNYIRADFGGSETVSVTFDFEESIAHFGVMIRDVEQAILTFTTDTGMSGTAAVIAENDVAQFFGLSIGGSEAEFNSITFTMQAPQSGNIDGVVFDQVTAGVPTPGALALLGLGGMVAGRRRR